MSLNRYAKKRDDNERSIIDALEHAGALVVQLDKPCDLLVGFAQRWWLLEVKMPTKSKLTEDQDKFFREHAAHGDSGIATVVHSIQEALSTIGCESRGVDIGPRIMSSPWLDGTGGEP